MKSAVIYSSKSGNTEKIAIAIAGELKIEKMKVNKDNAKNVIDLSPYDLIFIGTGIHYSNPNEDLMTFLKNVSFNAPKHCAIFITWGGAGKTNQAVLNAVEGILQSKGQIIIANSFSCYGGWNFLRRGHPNADELKNAKEWANKIIQTLPVQKQSNV